MRGGGSVPSRDRCRWPGSGLLIGLTPGTVGRRAGGGLDWRVAGFSEFAMLTVVVFGLVGYWMQKYGFPLAPAVLGLVLGPLIETSLRRALQISGGDLGTFVDGPMAVTLTVLIVVVLLVPALLALRRRRGAPLGLIGQALEGTDEDDHLTRATTVTTTTADAEAPASTPTEAPTPSGRIAPAPGQQSHPSDTPSGGRR